MTRKHKPFPIVENVTIEAVAAEGKCITHIDEMAVFVPFVVPGDVVDFAYKAYKTTKPSSRFVQDLNELQFSTLNVGYDFKHCTFIKRWGLQQLKASFYMNDIFRASTVEIERGLTYPFARTYSLSLQATF